jgi:hypothetical protein
VISPDPGCWAGHLRSSELLGESRQATPAELAAIRVDFAAWLSRLSDRHREIALCLAVGEPTGTVAQRFDVSCARISQVRADLAIRWRQFQGELPQPDRSASRLAGGRPPGARRAASTPVDANPAPIAVHTLLSRLAFDVAQRPHQLRLGLVPRRSAAPLRQPSCRCDK